MSLVASSSETSMISERGTPDGSQGA
jgi:hypothetical protein